MPKKLLVAVLTGLLVALTVTGCSDDKKESKSEPKKEVEVRSEKENNPFDHSHEAPVTDVQKHKFEHEFAAQCAQRELADSPNKEAESGQVNKNCMCIAEYMMKDLTSQEAEKFLTAHENPLSLKMKFDAAAYHCLQQKLPEQKPGFSHP